MSVATRSLLSLRYIFIVKGCDQIICLATKTGITVNIRMASEMCHQTFYTSVVDMKGFCDTQLRWQTVPFWVKTWNLLKNLTKPTAKHKLELCDVRGKLVLQ